MRVQLQPAFVLHKRPYRDTSQLLEVLTADHGRLSLVAKGTRRKGRGGPAGAILQPFIPLLLSFSGRAELKTLTGSEVAGEVTSLKGEHLFSGIYLNELLVRLLHRNDAHRDLFIAYGEAIADLGHERVLDDTLRRFEFRLLDELGYGFDMASDGHSGAPVAAGHWYCYHQDYGLVEQPPGANPGNPVFPGEDLLRIAQGDYSGPARLTCKRLLRQALAGYLGDKPLKSRELFRQSIGQEQGGES